MLNLRQIEAFRAIMIAGSMTGAASQLRISQPARSRMLRRIEDGGKYQKGYIYASQSITPEDWYFPFHFYQDSVMPGALGVESILQAMQTYALQLDLGKSFKNPRFGQAINHQITWKYRGQITPENRLMSLEVHISDIRVEDDVITIIGDASLWKEDLRIYEIKDIALCLLDSEE